MPGTPPGRQILPPREIGRGVGGRTLAGPFSLFVVERGQSVPCAVNLARNTVRFPVPDEFKAVADRLLQAGAGAVLDAGEPTRP